MLKRICLKYFLTLLIFLTLVLSAYPQNIIVYNSGNSGLPNDDVTCITPDRYGAKWIGTSDSGIVKFYNNQWTRYDSANSGVPGNKIRDIVFDRNGIMWVIISEKGLGRYDGQNWILYNSSNSPLVGVSCIAVDSNDTKWMVTRGRLAKFDNSNWTLFDTANGGFYSGSFQMDFAGDTLWIAAGLKGLARYCNGSLNYYNMQNSGIPDNVVLSLYIDKSRNKWVGTMFGGAAKFNSVQNIWTNFNLMDSLNLGNNSVPDIISDDSSAYFNTSFGLYRYSRNGFQLINNGGVNCLNYDKYFNLWIGNTNEVVIYNPKGIVNVKNESVKIPDNFSLIQNYPNPFNPVTKIKFSIPAVSSPRVPGGNLVQLKVYDVTGREVQTLVNERLQPGTYEASFDGSALNTGVYFYKLVTGNFSETKKMLLIK